MRWAYYDDDEDDYYGNDDDDDGWGNGKAVLLYKYLKKFSLLILYVKTKRRRECDCSQIRLRVLLGNKVLRLKDIFHIVIRNYLQLMFN